MSVGLYISVPFCRSKCSFCNFASDVFSRDKMNDYMARIEREIANIEAFVSELGARFERYVDTIYLGGGTPTTLAVNQLRDIFRVIHANFDVKRDAEITVECAPGTLRPEVLEALLECGVNRVSLGTQSFVDAEIKSVGRLHTAQQALADIAALRSAGITNLNVDLIAGLPHQTPANWRKSLEELSACEVPHASVYLLEVDEDSRLGRELIAGGARYHAHRVPDSDLAADFYVEAIEFLGVAGLAQYEISNFASPGRESLHNLKYWMRQPYLGFGLDAHSMLPALEPSRELESVRFSNTDELKAYLSRSEQVAVTHVTQREAEEEAMFLGLRMNQGVDATSRFSEKIQELVELGLLRRNGERIQLTARGRLLSNEVFERFIQNHEVSTVRGSEWISQIEGLTDSLPRTVLNESRTE